MPVAPRLPWPSALWLVRHGESRGNVADRRAHEQGAGTIDLDARDADVELSDRGRAQAEALGRWLRDLPEQRRPDLALASPYSRASDTARVALEASGLGLALRHDERLRERDLGVLDGLTGTGIRERLPEEAARRSELGKFYYRPPGGESWCDLALRLRSVLLTLREEHADERLLVVTHQAVIMVFRYVLEGLSEHELLDVDAAVQLGNAAVTRYERGEDGRLHLEAFDDREPVAGAGTSEEPDEEVPSDAAGGGAPTRHGTDGDGDAEGRP